MESNGKRCALYIRVSTGEQHLDNQRGELVRMCRARGYEIVRAYEETVSSVAKHREQYERMRLDAHRGGAFDCIAVWALDRLGRSMIGNMQAVLDFDRLGVPIVSVREPWLDTGGGPVRSLLVAIFGWCAEQERAQVSARTRLAMQKLKAEGKPVGRPPVHVDLPRALTLRANGRSIRQIARELGIGASTLHRTIQVHDALSGAVPKGSAVVQVGDHQESAAILGVVPS